MNLRSIFSKPVDRKIEGVIKADDDASLRLEVDEYVLTNEVEKRLEEFLDAYNDYQGANGVWVSGFFGSGKSHLLKMLALLLENRDLDGVAALDLFLPKIEGNEILRAQLRRAVAIPSTSILFNIDQKADVISKDQTDAVLAVFVKVFDEMRGYYGKQGYIAQFERDLDSRGQLAEFKQAFEAISGRSWHMGREQALLEAKNIAQAYTQVTGDDSAAALGILDKYRSQYRLSIEDFAEEVQAYIEQQPAGFRLNFFVDEVGQYIADNVKLMTNLQTLAESLATKSRGRAWIIVTAQEEMGSVLGDLGGQKGDDFTKIQARFANRLKLTSADVAEVIQRRLLAKNERGEQLLSGIYDQQVNNFRTLFDFDGASPTYRNFQDEDHFVQSYPFVPYQFALFQAAIQNLSVHNAFEGKHSSVGERSMLGVFQQVAIQISDHELGELATFDLMFEGLRSTLKSSIQRTIIQAENHLEDMFAQKLLKALFLVKYVKEFKPTLRNLSVLMLDGFNRDLPALQRRIEEALTLLEQQTYVQRNGEVFEFLTDEEKDIEQEIKATDVEAADIASELEKLVFDGVIKYRKIRHDESGNDYPFTKKLDDRLHGREQELAIHVISPFHEHADDESMLQLRSGGFDELLVVMPPDERLVRELMMYKKTEKYIRQNISMSQQDTVKRILQEKGHQNRERSGSLQQRVQDLLGTAKLFVGGTPLEVSAGDAQTRIIRGFHELVARAYPNLAMLRGHVYVENDLARSLQSVQDGLYNNLSEAEQEQLAFIQSNARQGVRTTLKSLLERFERKPNGWSYAAILNVLAKLFARGRVEARTDGNLIASADLERMLRNSHGHANVILEPQTEFTQSQVRQLKEFYGDFFHQPAQADEAKALANETIQALKDLLNDLAPIAAQSAQYPFLQALGPVMAELKQVSAKPYTWYLTDLQSAADQLLEVRERVIDPIQRFMDGSQRSIFDRAQAFITSNEPNFSDLDGTDTIELLAMLNDPEAFRGNHMQQLGVLLESVQAQVIDRLAAEKGRVRDATNALRDRLCAMNEFDELSAEQKNRLMEPFNEFVGSLEDQGLIAVIRDRFNRFDAVEYPRLLNRIGEWSVRHPEPDAAVSEGAEPKAPESRPEPVVVHVKSTEISARFDKAWLAEERDVHEYIDWLREELLQEVNSGKRIVP